jgi:hypothetical protein
MINVKLKDTIFTSGKPFHGEDRNRAVLIIGAGRNDLVIGKRNNMPPASLNYYGFQTGLHINTRGQEFEDIMLETIVTNPNYRASYGAQLIDLVERDYIEVCQDGTALTAVQLRTYTAP